MTVPVLPAYMREGKATLGASPGLQFGFYLDVWKWSDNGIIKDTDKQNRNVEKSLALTDEMRKLQDAVFERQSWVAESLSATGRLWLCDGISVSPFTTGLGIEHPLENGFAFSMPYGLPYFPGSGVKGVLRKAATELASGQWGGGGNWNATAIKLLFGPEPSAGEADQEKAQRGLLSFWDVYPRLPTKGNLTLEIMTPHQSHYLQAAGNSTTSNTPHDSGQPIPVTFVSVPPQTGFSFFVQCDLARLQVFAESESVDSRDSNVMPIAAELLAGGWQELLQLAFDHAFNWVGFGAKTAVGYGAMIVDTAKVEQRVSLLAERDAELEKQNMAQAETARIATLDDIDRRVEEAIKELTDPPGGPGCYLTRIQAIESIDWSDVPEKKVEGARRLRTLMQQNNVWKETTQKKKPLQDKLHQRTLKVLKWIDGS